MALQSLTSMFELNQTALKEKLEGLKLPSDSSKIQNIINTYLNEMFDNEGDFRQSLTQSEDYILQAALSLLNAQQSITREMTPNISFQQPKEQLQPQSKSGLMKEQYPLAVVGTAIGGTLGGALMGTWAAVFGAITGTAVALYYASTLPQSSSPQMPVKIEKPRLIQSELNVELLLSIIKNICTSVDSLIDTFRSQVNRIVHKYENQEKPTLEKEYYFLLETVQSVIGYKRAHNSDEKFLQKIQERIEDMAEILDNYNLSVVDYAEEHKNWFDTIESSKVTEITQILPAIVKNNHTVLKGRIFIPISNPA